MANTLRLPEMDDTPTAIERQMQLVEDLRTNLRLAVTRLALMLEKADHVRPPSDAARGAHD